MTSPSTVLAWEDDPGAPDAPRTPVERPAPELGGARLPLEIEGRALPPGPAGTAGFRWWAAAEALARGRDLWVALVPPSLGWQDAVGEVLAVVLDGSQPDLNAYYDRRALHFFHDTVRGVTVYSGESPDILCHELGHAVLDALRPELWDAAGTEPAAFHESFGDLSALFGALELPALRTIMLEETGDRAERSSRVSRLAEQLGWAVALVSPGGADAGCLRDAANSWFYRDPADLPPDGPATELSTEPHSFSRVFTGAMLKALAGMYEAGEARGEAALHGVARDLATLLLDAVLATPIVPTYFSQLAAHMLEADADRFGGRYAEPLRSGFVRHGVLALSSATSLARDAAPPRVADFGDLPCVTLPGSLFGLPAGLQVRACAHPRRFGVAGAGPVGAAPSPGSDRAAEIFVEDLFRQGLVDVAPAGLTAVVAGRPAFPTHELLADGDGYVLRRRRFQALASLGWSSVRVRT